MESFLPFLPSKNIFKDHLHVTGPGPLTRYAGLCASVQSLFPTFLAKENISAGSGGNLNLLLTQINYQENGHEVSTNVTAS